MNEDGLETKALYPAVNRAVGLFALLIRQVRAEAAEAHHEPVRNNWRHGGLRGGSLGKHSVRKPLARSCHAVIPINAEEAQRHKDDDAAAKEATHANAGDGPLVRG